MYKEVIITIIIVVLIISMDIITNNYTDKATKDLSSQLEVLREKINNKNDIEIINQTNEILNKWKEYYNVLAYYIEHDELEKVETQLTMLKADEESQKYEDCINEIDTTIFILKHIEDKEKFSIQSIF